MQQGDVDESEASGSYGESGQWGGVIQGNHEAVAMDMAMLGCVPRAPACCPTLSHATCLTLLFV